MTTVAVNNRGERLAFTVQSAFQTINTTTPKDLRVEGEITVATPLKQSVQLDSRFVDAHDAEKPVTFETSVADAAKAKIIQRQATAAGGVPSAVTLFKAAGCTAVTSADDNTVASTASTAEVTLTSGTTVPGEYRVIELSDGTFFPALIAKVTGQVIVPFIALPSATEAGKAVPKCFTITPGQPAKIADDVFLSLFHADNSATLQDDAINMTGTFVSSIDDIEIAPGRPIEFGFNFSAAKVAYGSGGALMTTANDFADGTAVKIVDNPIVQMVAYDDEGAIASACAKLIKATIHPGIMAEGVPGWGCTDTLNGLQGAMKTVEPCTVTLEILFDTAKITDWEGTNASYAINIVNASSAETVPSFAFTAPRCHIMEAPTTDKTGNNILMTVKYQALPAQIDDTTTIGAQLNQPFYMCLSDRSA